MRKVAIVLGTLGLLIFGLMTAKHFRGNLVPVDEGPQAKGKLGELRSAISIFYGDSGGHYPERLDSLVPKYLSKIPQINELREHAPSSAIILVNELSPRDSGGWLYVNNPESKSFGEIRIDCTHTDGQRAWFEF